jgi:DNA-binding NtrC family response regulator
VTTEPLSEKPAPMRLAVVDDDPAIRRIIRTRAEREGLIVEEFERGADIVRVGADAFDAVCLDVGLGPGDMSGMEVLPHLRASSPEVPVIMVTAQSDLESVVEAMRAGAYDFVSKPIDGERLKLALGRALERRQMAKRIAELLRQLDTARERSLIVGASAPVRQMLEIVSRVVDSDVAVCILGESGTGKELVARSIHEGGRRKKGPFVAINCASIPEHLQESELFGHEKGAFTGAANTHRGRFEQAEGGTLFLDELGDMSLSTQVKLLRAIQEKAIRRVGGVSDIPTNVRLVAATHRDLEVLVRKGAFREDLYFRLMVYPVEVPPLRDRLDDIPLLVAHFLRMFREDVGRPISRISKEALDALAMHRWSGNIRELQNVVHRAMLTCPGDEIGLSDLPPALQKPALPPVPTDDAPQSLRPRSLPTLVLKELENMAIQAALAATNGHIASAAKLLGIGRATLYRRVVESGMKVDLEAEEKT